MIEARGKPIIDMLEDIRRTMIKRIQKERELAESQFREIYPTIYKKLDKTKVDSYYWGLTHFEEKLYEVRHNSDGYIVYLSRKTYSCGHWKLNGVPCPHVMACMYHPRAEDMKNMQLIGLIRRHLIEVPKCILLCINNSIFTYFIE